jgi:hypothetical protein
MIRTNIEYFRCKFQAREINFFDLTPGPSPEKGEGWLFEKV